jgi:hypothetical protein
MAAPRPHAPDFERADPIGEFWSYPKSRPFAELLIDCEEDRGSENIAEDSLRRGFAAGSPVARLAASDVHHPSDRKSRERPTVVKGVRTQRRRTRAKGGPDG